MEGRPLSFALPSHCLPEPEVFAASISGVRALSPCTSLNLSGSVHALLQCFLFRRSSEDDSDQHGEAGTAKKRLLMAALVRDWKDGHYERF